MDSQKVIILVSLLKDVEMFHDKKLRDLKKKMEVACEFF